MRILPNCTPPLLFSLTHAQQHLSITGSALSPRSDYSNLIAQSSTEPVFSIRKMRHFPRSFNDLPETPQLVMSVPDCKVSDSSLLSPFHPSPPLPLIYHATSALTFEKRTKDPVPVWLICVYLSLILRATSQGGQHQYYLLIDGGYGQREVRELVQ